MVYVDSSLYEEWLGEKVTDVNGLIDTIKYEKIHELVTYLNSINKKEMELHQLHQKYLLKKSYTWRHQKYNLHSYNSIHKQPRTRNHQRITQIRWFITTLLSSCTLCEFLGQFFNEDHDVLKRFICHSFCNIGGIFWESRCSMLFVWELECTSQTTHSSNSHWV